MPTKKSKNSTSRKLSQKEMRALLQIIVVMLIVLVLDQCTKWLMYAQNIAVINSEMAWSMNVGSFMVGMPLLLAAIVAMLSVWLQKFWLERPLFAGLFFGAAISNLIDRWMLAGVLDWIEWPVISVVGNFADVCLAAVAIALVCQEIQKARQ